MTGMTFEGIVEHGRQLGRELGFPTANLPVAAECPAEDGVYESVAEVEGVCYRAMSNLGSNPSVGGKERRLETHLFGFSGSLYGVRLRVVLVRRLRGEMKFASLDALRARIARDMAEILGDASADGTGLRIPDGSPEEARHPLKETTNHIK